MEAEPPRVPRVRRPRYSDPSAEVDKENDLFYLRLTPLRWIKHPEMRRYFVRMTLLVLSLAGGAWGSWLLAQWLATVL